ncbi:MAG TPA: hypothetical protein EYG68_01545 [Leucothrix mucor]|nr:hypothetical protein [Leucothrix mucor]
MKTLNYSHKLLALLAISAPLLLSACGSSTQKTRSYELTVSNLTANQPLSPVVVFAHEPEYKLWQTGHAASVALEYLAEGGSNSQLVDEVKATKHYMSHTSGTGAIGSGQTETITISFKNTNWVRLSLASMLVNTNDAFTGLADIEVYNIAVGESKTFDTLAWDAGTEENTESSGTIPGPADGGEGFNASRVGDSNFIAAHQGVISKDDGFASSVLNESHRFDNPVARVTIRRIK